MTKMIIPLLLVVSGCGTEGAQGPKGDQGAPAVTEVIDPCGDAVGVVDEVLLRLSSGELLASFSAAASGLNTRFSIIPPGSYVTTDGSGCRFTVTIDGEVL